MRSVENLKKNFQLKSNHIIAILSDYKNALSIEAERIRGKYGDDDKRILLLSEKIELLSVSIFSIGQTAAVMLEDKYENYQTARTGLTAKIALLNKNAISAMQFSKEEQSELFEPQGKNTKTKVMKFLGIKSKTHSHLKDLAENINEQLRKEPTQKTLAARPLATHSRSFTTGPEAGSSPGAASPRFFHADNEDKFDAYTNEELMCRPADLTGQPKFENYAEPNEGTPINVQPHLNFMETGWIVSVGTERSFYDLLLSPEEKCEGLIIRDFHPQIKAYNDFLILLLWCANDREDFCNLSSYRSDNSSLNSLQEEIKDRITKVNMPPAFSDYFMNNFKLLAKAYLRKRHMPPAGDNTGVEYRIHDHLFEKLQRYVRAGRVISTLGDINDLSFTRGRKVSVIDTSNAPDYTFIKPTGYDDSTPRMIFTMQSSSKTIYRSALYEKINEQEMNKIQTYMNLFRSALSVSNFLCTVSSWMPKSPENDVFNQTNPSCFTKDNILKIKNGFAFLINFKNPDALSHIESLLTVEAYQALQNRVANKKPETTSDMILDELLKEPEKAAEMREKVIQNNHSIGPA